MTKQTFYELLKAEGCNRKDMNRLTFKMDDGGPKYRVILGDKYSDPKDSVVNGDFTLGVVSSTNGNISDEAARKSILNRLYHIGDKIIF